MTRRSVLALTTSPLPIPGQITDGPGFRMWNLLAEVAKHHEVRILSLYESLHQHRRGTARIDPAGMPVEFVSHRPGAVARRVREIGPDVLYLPWSSAGFLGGSNRNVPTILDYVGPGLLETFADEGRIPLPLLRLKIGSFWYGDLFITTTERERFYLLGLLAASRRLSRRGYARDDPIVRVVRMTPPELPPSGARRERRSSSDPLVVLLAGAFLPWYDYDLIRRAWAALPAEARSGVRLRVLGGNPRMPAVERRVREILASGAIGGTEFLGTVPFAERVPFYLAADVGLSLPSSRLEDEQSARTRVVDYLWAGLPLLSEGRDEYSSLILEGGAGFRYEHSPSSLAGVLDRLRQEPELTTRAHDRCASVLRTSFDAAQESIPVLEFLDSPRVSDRSPPVSSSLEMAGLWAVDVAGSVRRRVR